MMGWFLRLTQRGCGDDGLRGEISGSYSLADVFGEKSKEKKWKKNQYKSMASSLPIVLLLHSHHTKIFRRSTNLEQQKSRKDHQQCHPYFPSNP